MRPHSRTCIALILSLFGTAAFGQTPSATATEPQEPDVARIVRTIRADDVERTIRTLVAFGTRNTLSSQDDPKRGIGAARDWLYGEFLELSKRSGNRLQVEKQAFVQPVGPRVPQPTTLTNIVGVLPGNSGDGPPRYVVISGHYDSMCTSPIDAIHDAPGADDDASGVATVLAAARAMVPYRYHATIVFMCVAGEEQGLLGSTYFAQQAKQNDWHIESMFTNDIVGASLGGNGVRDAHSIRVFSEGIASDETAAEARTRRSVGGEEDSPSRQIARYIKETSEKYVPGMKVTLVARRDRYLRGGDHIPFNERGYPAVRFTEPNENYHHQHQDVRTADGVAYGDLPEYVDFAYLANVARVNAAALASLAASPDVPRGAGLVTRRLTEDTDLEWTMGTEPDLAGYEVVWRGTTEPVWTHSLSVGKVSQYTVKGLSKDNYIFGVRAVDSRGRKSPVAFPRPVR